MSTKELREMESESRERIAAICARRDWTRGQLAHVLGVSKATLWRWSRAICSPPPEAEAQLRELYRRAS